MLKLKIFEQTKTGYCGPAALKMAFWFYGLKASEKELAKRAKTTQKMGTGPANMIRAVKSFDWHGFWKEGGKVEDLKYFIKQGKPVVVDWFSVDEGHYSVAVGLDKKFVYLADPEFGKTKRLPTRCFKNVWFDFEGPYTKHLKKCHFGWLLVPTPKRIRYKIRGNYF